MSGFTRRSRNRALCLDRWIIVINYVPSLIGGTMFLATLPHELRSAVVKTFKVVNIEWETDRAGVNLPTVATVRCDDEEGIAAALSDEHGWLVSGYVVESCMDD